MNVVGIQFDIVWETKEKNFDIVKRLVNGAAIPPGSLIVLPEMFATGFSMNAETIGQHEPERTETFLSELSKSTASYVVAGLVTLDEDGRGRNEAFVLGPDGKRVARYRKFHPFSLSGENRHFRPGDELVAFAWNGFTVAPAICYDLRFPELFRQLCKQRVDLLVVIACWPNVREDHWLTLLKARAIENQSYVLGVNRCGMDPTLAYSGKSVLYDYKGNILALAGGDEAVIQAKPDPASLAQYRADLPFLRDMRADLLPDR